MANVNVETYCMDVFHYSLDDLQNFLKRNTFDLVCLSFMEPRFKRSVQAAFNVIKRAKKRMHGLF